MIARYTLPEMGRIWTDENRYAKWLDVELAACRAWNKLGRIPGEALAEIEAKAAFEVARVEEIEAETRHDVIAFLDQRGRARGSLQPLHPPGAHLQRRVGHRLRPA